MDSMSYLSSPIQWSRLGETNHVISSYMACYYPLESNQIENQLIHHGRNR
jgi:hypothetical protein